MKGRKGVSLIEALVLMSAASTVLSLCGVMVHRAMRAQARAEAFHDDESAAWRLSSDLRRDLRRATDATAVEADGDWVVTLAGDGEPVVWRFGAEAVTREREAADGPTAREAYRFGGAAGWEVERLDNPARLSVTAIPAPHPGRTAAGAGLRLRVVDRLAPEGSP